MDGAEAAMYIQRIMDLDILIAMWPPAREEYQARRKADLVDMLDRIASGMKTARPQTFVLKEAPALPISPRGGKMYIMKRELSDGSRHFKPPPAVNVLTQVEVEAMRRPGLPWRWLIQDCVPYLRSVGEWRLVMLNGKVHHACSTSPLENSSGFDLTEHHPVTKQWSLSEMR